MKLKKKTSMMLVAASTAAIIGVAAVSFAAWTGKGQDTLDADAYTGTLNTFGFGNVETLALVGTNIGTSKTEEDKATTNKLVPYDQSAGSVLEGAYILKAQLPDYTVFAEGFTISVSVENATDDYKIYAKLTTESVSETNITLDGWTQITAAGVTMVTNESNAETITFTKEGTDGHKTETLYIILDSKKVQPEQAINFKFTITLTSASYAPEVTD